MEGRQLTQLAEQVKAGATWRAACRAAGVPLSTGYAAAVRRFPELGGKRPRLTSSRRQKIRRELLAGRLSRRAIAARNRCSPDTVSRIAAAMIAEELAAEGLTPLRRTRPRRCGGCGAKITTAICQRCQLCLR